jgi:hypothetical protein
MLERANRERGESSGGIVLSVLAVLVVITAVTIWATRPAPKPTSVAECHEQGGTVEPSLDGDKLSCWLQVGDPDEDEHNRIRLPATEPPTEP